MKELVSKVRGFLQNLWGDLLPALVKNGNASVKVVNIIKDVINSPVLNLAVALTPTQKDDAVLRKAKVLATEAVATLGFAMGIVSYINAGEDPKLVAKWVSEYLKDNATDSQKAIFYRELAGLILEALMDDGKISTGEYVAIGQFLFKKRL